MECQWHCNITVLPTTQHTLVVSFLAGLTFMGVFL
uniref:Uncharacterized protein n=1 Tax=Rhizophora mucronata TaxID=61149 RepID=A0A2P2PC25_RHIMU